MTALSYIEIIRKKFHKGPFLGKTTGFDHSNRKFFMAVILPIRNNDAITIIFRRNIIAENHFFAVGDNKKH